MDFIRSSPEWPEVPKGAAPQRVDGSVPIISVRWFENALQVSLQKREWEGWHVNVAQRNGDWIVQRIGFWIN